MSQEDGNNEMSTPAKKEGPEGTSQALLPPTATPETVTKPPEIHTEGSAASTPESGSERSGSTTGGTGSTTSGDTGSTTTGGTGSTTTNKSADQEDEEGEEGSPDYLLRHYGVPHSLSSAKGPGDVYLIATNGRLCVPKKILVGHSVKFEEMMRTSDSGDIFFPDLRLSDLLSLALWLTKFRDPRASQKRFTEISLGCRIALEDLPALAFLSKDFEVPELRADVLSCFKSFSKGTRTKAEAVALLELMVDTVDDICDFPVSFANLINGGLNIRDLANMSPTFHASVFKAYATLLLERQTGLQICKYCGRALLEQDDNIACPCVGFTRNKREIDDVDDA